jgi:tetratricopeptide (TPR) repeat protein/transcriptional regulator with XRE-family HTH domain
MSISDGGMLAMQDGAVTNGAVKRGRLAQRRKAVGLTQEQLAGQLGVERTTVVRWERGQTQPLPWLGPRLAKALGVSADRLEELLAADAAAGPRSRGAVVPRQLPAAVADFTGRAAELAALTAMLDQAGAGAPGTVVISAIGGTAGVGKTALALRWAHQVAARFGDGQLYVNLRGFDPSGVPAAPEAAIRGFLDALGVPPERIPPGPEAQAGLYRSLLAGRRMLIVLDNARDEQQVRPLLPASPGTLVLVTSRSQLAGLAAAHGARVLTLDVLSHEESTQLLAARVGDARAAAEPGAVSQIASLCACLPLALAVAAARAAARPHLCLAALADELRDSPGRLDALDAGDPAASIRTVFSWSYRQLSPDAARMFRLLGLHPGPDITAAAAASLAGCELAQARHDLGELARAHLIAEHVPGRYVLHDLLRAYAADCTAAEDEQARHAAAGQVLDHYLHTARAADALTRRSGKPVTIPPPRPGVRPEHLVGHRQALTWLAAEHQVLLAAITFADSNGFDAHAWQIPLVMSDFLERRGHWHQWAAILDVAAAAAARAGNRTGQAEALHSRAWASERLGDHDQALAKCAASLSLYQQIGDSLGEANMHQYLAARQLLAAAADSQDRYVDALGHAEQAVRVYHAAGNRPAEAITLNIAGLCHARLGDYQQARVASRRALTLTSEVGQRHYQAYAWKILGFAEHHLGNLAEAAACYQRALIIFREFGNLLEEASTLALLGDSRQAAGELPRARNSWQQALIILKDLQHPDADQVRAKLASTDDHASPNPPA